MEKDIPLKIEILSKEHDGALSISSPEEIKYVLFYIAEVGNRVALYYDGENDFILTTLLAVDDGGLWLELGPNDSINKCVAKSHRLIFISSHLQVKVQFTANQANIEKYKGNLVFHLALPDNLFRVQRREYFRLMTPIINPLRCIISKGSTNNQSIREFIIMDVSCGGVGLVCREDDTELVPGSLYENCQIELPEHGIITGTIEVKNLIQTTSKSGIIKKRAGCEFKNLEGSSIILLQRYITHMQQKSPITKLV
jgi:c-di-GMP-binding flagellar brake protein YcgR